MFDCPFIAAIMQIMLTSAAFFFLQPRFSMAQTESMRLHLTLCRLLFYACTLHSMLKTWPSCFAVQSFFLFLDYFLQHDSSLENDTTSPIFIMPQIHTPALTLRARDAEFFFQHFAPFPRVLQTCASIAPHFHSCPLCPIYSSSLFCIQLYSIPMLFRALGMFLVDTFLFFFEILKVYFPPVQGSFPKTCDM